MPAAAATTNASKANEDSLQHSKAFTDEDSCGEDRPRRTAPISTTASDSSGDATVDSADDARTPWPAYGPQDGALTTLSDDRQAGETRQQTVKSLAIITEAYDKYKPEELCLAFNGGKDCTVLLHMVDHVFRQKHSEGVPLKTLYIADPKNDTFEEVESFIADMQKIYNLDIMRVVGGVKVGLERVKEEHPEVKAIFMGSRSTDPYCGDLVPFARTSEGWPDFMRVNPILDWSYRDVWEFIDLYGVQYCELYKYGYTSIGRKSDTIPNPDLLIRDDDGHAHYKHARELVDGSKERSGRYVKRQ
ncbi:3'-phosphoadenosine 5'-phosphosulfate sulfotransferase [Perkinsus olseni]|uniref:FAD synthase n=2 Tax=Perkinsus olseni TaxID=32597 RepID=A0A7J6PNL5_PEROL|nr:3'-phosphoadenosine 5'-phosphosulfate sulfotransferase [Perkinsus olseni]